jgi:hypothetical protein
MKIYFGVMRFVFILLFLGVYQAQAAHYTWRFANVPGWGYEAVNQANAFAIWLDGHEDHPSHDAARLWVNTVNNQSWAAVGREFKFPAAEVGKRSTSGVNILATGDYVVNMEVINPSNWTYLAVQRESGRGDGFWMTVESFPSFTIPSRSLYYRVSYLGTGVVKNTWTHINVPYFWISSK